MCTCFICSWCYLDNGWKLFYGKVSNTCTKVCFIILYRRTKLYSHAIQKAFIVPIKHFLFSWFKTFIFIVNFRAVWSASFTVLLLIFEMRYLDIYLKIVLCSTCWQILRTVRIFDALWFMCHFCYQIFVEIPQIEFQRNSSRIT